MKFLKTIGVLMLLLLSLNIVSAAQEAPDVGLLTKLGIVTEDIVEKESITRAEFAEMAVRFMNIDAAQARKIFTDVELDSLGAPEITTLYDLGYVLGDGNLNFNPDEPIMTIHAAKIIVSALGYHDVCSLDNSFISKAQTLGLLKGLDSGVVLDGYSCVELLNNALEASVLEVKSFGEKTTYGYSRYKDALYNYFDLEVVEGVVSCVDGASLTGVGNNSLKKIIIDDAEYSILDGSNYGSLLGYNVKAYVNVDDDDVVYCVPYDNDCMEFSMDDINKSKTTLRKISSNNGKTYSLSSEVDYLYNGNGYFELTLDEMISDCGTITLIDNDDNGQYDVVSVYDYTSCAVSVVNYDSLALTDFYGTTLPSLEDAKRIEVLKNGKQISFSDIAQSNVALVAIDKTMQFAKILISDTRVSGVIDSISEYEIQIGEDKYEIAPSLLKVSDSREKLSPGNKVELRLDAFGKIAYIRSAQNDNLQYGYLMDIAFSGGMDSNYKVKMLSENGQIDVIESKVNSQLDDKEATEEKLRAAFWNFGEFEQQIVKYAVNSDGKLSKMYSLSGGKISMDFQYTQRAQASGGLRVFAPDGDFVYNANTVIFSVPMYPEDAVDEDYTIAAQVSGDYKTSQIAAFDVNEHQIATAVVRKNATTMNTGTVNNDDKNYNPLLVVDRITKSLNYKDEEEYILHCYSRNGIEEYFVDEDKYALVKDLKKGDVILLRYNQATDHVIDVYKNICDAVNSKTFGHVDEAVSTTDGARWFEWIYGRVYSRYGDTVKISDRENPSKPSDYRVYVAGTAKVIVVTDRTIRYGSLADVTPDSVVILRSRGPSVQEIIIYE